MRVAGIGCRENTSAETLDALVRLALPLDRLATLVDREAVIAPVAAAFGLHLSLWSRDALLGVDTPTSSRRIVARFGTGSVAEALALVAAGRGARMIRRRIVSHDRQATLAIACLMRASTPSHTS